MDESAELGWNYMWRWGIRDLLAIEWEFTYWVDILSYSPKTTDQEPNIAWLGP